MSDSSDSEQLYDNESLLSDDEDEVMPSDDGEDEEEEDDDQDFDQEDLHGDKFSRFKIERKKDEMASDIEDDDEDDSMPNSQAWGKNKKLFYDTDYVDKDFRSQRQKDEDLSKYEEEEALAIQKRLLESVSEQDLGLDFLIDGKPKTTSTSDATEVLDKSKQKAELDLTTLKKDQKLAIIRRESPELEVLVADLKKYLNEIKSQLEPVLNCLQRQNAPSTSGLKYLKLRYVVLLNYCTNVAFYLSLMSSQDKQNVKEHPIIQKIFTHKKFISELDSCVDRKGKKFAQEMDVVLESLQQNSAIPFVAESETVDEDQLPASAELAAASKYSAPEDENAEESDGDNEDEDGGKRAITYEMEKNKGLIPKRKREQRNPRVKYRKKFEKAVIRRKGQVREPRKELKKYGGEMTGINARTVKSVKFR